jgi:alpha-D-ribose 1-methylphosphonate 5-triphosphate synthase subunit PhnH
MSDAQDLMTLADAWVVAAIHKALSVHTGASTTADPEAAKAAFARELLAAREDARRYRWLRRGDGKAPADGADWPLITMHLTDEAVWDTEADAAIDAAIAAEAPPAK